MKTDALAHGKCQPKSWWSRRVALLLLLLLPCSFLTSCATMQGNAASGFDPNPPADAIVGVWDFVVRFPDGTEGYVRRMFRSDGTGLRKSSTNLDDVSFFTWKYDGHGWWTEDGTLRYQMTKPSTPGGARFLHLLTNANGGPVNYRFERVTGN